MTTPISQLPTPPQPSDSPVEFDQKAFALLGGLPQFVAEANTLGSEMTTLGAETETAAEQAAQSAQAAGTSASAAAVSANSANDSKIASGNSAASAADSADKAEKLAPVESPEPPLNPPPGKQWINTTTGRKYTWFNDGNSSQWVEIEASVLVAVPDLRNEVSNHAILSYDTKDQADFAAATLPDGQEIEAPDTQGKLSRYRVQSGALVFQRLSEDAVRTNYTPSGVGAVARTVQAKLREVVSVKDFGALGNDSTDDAASIQSALNAGTGIVWAPPGTYRVSVSSTVPSNVRFVGNGEGSTILKGTGTNINLIEVGTGANNPNNVAVSDMSFTYTGAQTTSSAIRVRNGHNIKLDRLRFDSPFNAAIDLNGGAQQFLYYLSNIEVNNASGDAIKLGADGTLLQDVWFSKGVISGGAQSGILLKAVSGFMFSQIDILSCTNGITTYPDATKQVVYGFFDSVLVDTCNDWGWNIIENGGLVADLTLTSCWGSSCGVTTNAGGLRTNAAAGAVRGIEFNGGRFRNNKGPGMSFLSGSKITLTNVQVFGNSIQGSALSSGIEVAAGLSDFSIIGGCSGSGGQSTGNLQAYGIKIPAGASDRYRIIGVDVTGNVTGGITDGGTGTEKTIYGNSGYTTSKSGSAAVLNTTSSVVVTHNLSATPAQADILVVPIVDLAAAGIIRWWVSAVTATTFTITVNAATTADAFFAWSARVKGA